MSPRTALAAALALGVTGTALNLSVSFGASLGPVFVPLAVTATTMLHLLPAVTRGHSATLRAVAALVWVGCVAFIGYGHAHLFETALGAQGNARAAAVTVVTNESHARDFVTLASERARVTRDLEAVEADPCHDGCRVGRTKINGLQSSLTALDAETKSRQQYEDAKARAESERARAKDADRDSESFAIGLTMALSLEIGACVLWAVAIPATRVTHERVTAEPASVTAPPLAGYQPEPGVMPEPPPPVTGKPNHSPDLRAAAVGELVERMKAEAKTKAPRVTAVPLVSTEEESDLARVTAAIEAGHTRATVAAIREFLKCGTAKAQAIRSQLPD
jgi:hypothetical protein